MLVFVFISMCKNIHKHLVNAAVSQLYCMESSIADIISCCNSI